MVPLEQRWREEPSGPQNTGGRLCLGVPVEKGQLLGVHSVGMHTHGIGGGGALGRGPRASQTSPGTTALGPGLMGRRLHLGPQPFSRTCPHPDPLVWNGWGGPWTCCRSESLCLPEVRVMGRQARVLRGGCPCQCPAPALAPSLAVGERSCPWGQVSSTLCSGSGTTHRS